MIDKEVIAEHLPYAPEWSERKLVKYLQENFYKKSYDRFMWWRTYTVKTKPLTARASLLDRIHNGDFDLGPADFERQLVEHKLNQMYLEYINDPGVYVEKARLTRARRKRLLEDFEKDENNKLLMLRKAFIDTFKITFHQYEEEVVQYTGPDLINFYHFIDKKYGKRIKLNTSKKSSK